MAKNELLPFANGEDANVLPTTQWEALTDILENGFQSGIARSEQVNRVLAQGAVASYVLGQLIVDQLAQDATLDGTTLYQNLILALQENAKDACLPLSGGTMTGSIVMANNKAISGPDSSHRLQLYGGTSANTGSVFGVYGVNYTARPGWVYALATDGTNESELILKPDALTLNGGNVLAVESWSSGYNWYRVWGDGFIEQGGRYYTSSYVRDMKKKITFNKAFSVHADTILIQPFDTGTSATCEITSIGVNNVSKTGFNGRAYGHNSDDTPYGFYWYASGY